MWHYWVSNKSLLTRHWYILDSFDWFFIVSEFELKFAVDCIHHNNGYPDVCYRQKGVWSFVLVLALAQCHSVTFGHFQNWYNTVFFQKTHRAIGDVGDTYIYHQQKRLHFVWDVVWDVGDRFRMLVTDWKHWKNHQHNEKSRQHIGSVTNI